MDKLLMWNAVRNALLARFADVDFGMQLAETIWKTLDLKIENEEEALAINELFEECYEALIVKMVIAIK